MKLRLSILLLAAALAASPAAGQTIKSLGYNTTNGDIVAATNVTFTNSVGFATNARAATRTNLGGTTVGNAVFTATNAAAAATAVGLGETNSVTFSQVTVTNTFYPPTFTSTNGFYGAGSLRMTGSTTNTRLVYRMLGATPADRTVLNAEDNLINLSSASVARTNLGLGATWLTNTDVTNFRTAIGLGATNNVSFNQLTATGNVTLNGSDNLMPNATNAASASSLMTRDLSDERYTTSIWLTQFSDNQTITNGGLQLLAPGRYNSWSFGYGASVPSGFTEFRVVLGFGWMQNPATNSTNFPVFVMFQNRNAINASPTEAEHGTAFSRTDLYPTNAASTGLAGTLTRRAVFNTTNTVYSFISDWVTIPNAWQSNASSNGFYHIIGAAIANNTGGSLTDGYNVNHPAVGLIEFRK